MPNCQVYPMSNKALRLLIADAELLQRIKIEKMLNQLGYHRIAPLSCRH